MAGGSVVGAQRKVDGDVEAQGYKRDLDGFVTGPTAPQRSLAGRGAASAAWTASCVRERDAPGRQL